MLKKILSIMLSAVMLLPFTSLASAEGGDGSFAVNSVTAEPGSEFTVSISVKNSKKLAAFRVFLDFDDTVFEINSAETGEASNIVLGPTTGSPFTLLWMDTFGSSDNQDGVYATLTMASKSDAPAGDYALTLSYEEYDCVDISANPLDFAVENGKITLTGGSAKTTTTKKTTDKPKTTTTTTKETTPPDKTVSSSSGDKAAETTAATTAKSSQTTAKVSDESSAVSFDDGSSSADASSAVTVSVSEESLPSGGLETAAEASTLPDTSSSLVEASSLESSPDDDNDSPSAAITIIAFIGLCAVIAAVFIIVKKKQK